MSTCPRTGANGPMRAWSWTSLPSCSTMPPPVVREGDTVTSPHLWLVASPSARAVTHHRNLGRWLHWRPRRWRRTWRSRVRIEEESGCPACRWPGILIGPALDPGSRASPALHYDARYGARGGQQRSCSARNRCALGGRDSRIDADDSADVDAAQARKWLLRQSPPAGGLMSGVAVIARCRRRRRTAVSIRQDRGRCAMYSCQPPVSGLHRAAAVLSLDGLALCSASPFLVVGSSPRSSRRCCCHD